jgi:hypothetical protein
VVDPCALESPGADALGVAHDAQSSPAKVTTDETRRRAFKDGPFSDD